MDGPLVLAGAQCLGSNIGEGEGGGGGAQQLANHKSKCGEMRKKRINIQMGAGIKPCGVKY